MTHNSTRREFNVDQTTIEHDYVDFEATVGVRALDAMRRGLVDEFNAGGLPRDDLMNGLHLVEILYQMRGTATEVAA